MCECMDRFVPVIKMKVDGIPVDLLFVSLNVDSVPESIDILDDQLLRGLDEPSVGRTGDPCLRTTFPFA